MYLMRKLYTASAEQNLPSQNTLHNRRSFMQISALTSMAVCNSMTMGLLDRVRPIDQPQQFDHIDPTAYSSPRSLPPPDASIDFIMQELMTVEDYAAFVEKYTEFACEWAYRHRYTPYVISICPEGILEPIKDEWHQFAAMRTDQTAYIIFDNTSVIGWQGDIEEYIAEKHSHSVMLPIAGCAKWVKTQNNWTARMAYQTVQNEHDMELSEMPIISQRAAMQLALAKK